MAALKEFVLKIICDQLLNENENKSIISKNNFRIKKRNKVVKRKIINLRKYTPMIPKNPGFIKIILEFPDHIFAGHFRMSRSTFNFVENELKNIWATRNTGRPKLALKLALYLTIWKLANGSCFRELSNLFNVSIGAAFHCFLEIVYLIYQLKSKFIKWPTNLNETMAAFANLRDNPMPNVVGCVDGSHIPILAPSSDKVSYFNRKGVCSTNLQAICDSKQRFLDVFFGYPGSCHDANVWENSPIGRNLRESPESIVDCGHILGDSAYPLTTYLLVPYRDNGFLSPMEKRFNYVHSSTRVCIEQAFGRLKQKFRILKHVDIKKLEHLKYIVISCTVLHNIIIDREGLGENFLEVQSSEVDDLSNLNGNNATTTEAKQKRNQIAMLFCTYTL